MESPKCLRTKLATDSSESGMEAGGVVNNSAAIASLLESGSKEVVTIGHRRVGTRNISPSGSGTRCPR